MENTTMTTPFAPFADLALSYDSCVRERFASEFGMPRGAAFRGDLVGRAAWIPGTGLSIETPATGTTSRERQGTAVKGHVALAAVAIPGTPAWSPPLC
ncbi:hypothetical protein [Nocardioides litoris]|uniref:hypothetical protein n=1 Tax=Nocardioides litoris TaxID=1926648 RepID=UPI00111EE6D5|nr:hypothetical protein [Nocardioides litoris]